MLIWAQGQFFFLAYLHVHLVLKERVQSTPGSVLCMSSYLDNYNSSLRYPVQTDTMQLPYFVPDLKKYIQWVWIRVINKLLHIWQHLN
jgi:hypothetical protein